MTETIAALVEERDEREVNQVVLTAVSHGNGETEARLIDLLRSKAGDAEALARFLDEVVTYTASHRLPSEGVARLHRDGLRQFVAEVEHIIA